MGFVDRIRLRQACFWDLEKSRAGLIDKWRGMEFARQHGVPVPDLIWHGDDPYKIPADLPQNCVIKGSRGYNAQRVFLIVDGRHRSPASLTLNQIRSELAQNRVSEAETFLVQEFISTDGSTRIPLEYQFHMFGEHIGAIQCVNENEQTHRFYHADWRPFEFRVGTHRTDSRLQAPPTGLQSLCRDAITLGQAYGLFVRVDFLQSQSGFVFSEFCATPMGGACYTTESDQYFGDLWEEQLGDLI